jgi:hypothetical protein
MRRREAISLGKSLTFAVLTLSAAAGCSASSQLQPESSGDAGFDPRQYGSCLWDGRHDVTPCLQAAVESAAKDGGRVQLPAGTWPLGTALMLRDKVTLAGANSATTLLPTKTNTSDPVLVKGFGINGASIEHVTFDGGGQDFGNAHALIVITHANDIVIDNITVQNVRGPGLVLQGGITRSVVRNSHFEHIGNHWRTTRKPADRLQAVIFCCGTGNAHNSATGNYFEDIGLDSLQFSDQSYFTASRNTFNLENGEHALMAAPDFPAAIFPMNSIDSVITDNTINGAQGCGIDAPGLRQTGISGNRISNCQACGIGLFLGYDKTTNASDVTITGNTITDNVRWKESPFKGGITIASGSPHDIVITHNVVGNTTALKTQRFGVQVVGNTVVTALSVDSSNELGGNADAPISPADTSYRLQPTE